MFDTALTFSVIPRIWWPKKICVLCKRDRVGLLLKVANFHPRDRRNHFLSHYKAICHDGGIVNRKEIPPSMICALCTSVSTDIGRYSPPSYFFLFFSFHFYGCNIEANKDDIKPIKKKMSNNFLLPKAKDYWIGRGSLVCLCYRRHKHRPKSRPNGRFARVWGEHGRQPEMTIANVLPTRNSTLKPFQISFRLDNDLGAEIWAERNLLKFTSVTRSFWKTL